MAKLKYYRYALKEEGTFPKKNMVRTETAPEGFWGMAAYTTLLPDSTVKRYNLVDLNTDIKTVTRLRIMSGLKQTEMAEKLGVPFRTYQNWEIGGMGNASLSNTIKVADYFGIKDLRELVD